MSENDDSRKPLNRGTILNVKYEVRELVSNEGGSCLLYDCVHEDSNGNKVDVYVKEFYPKELGGKIARNSDDKKTIEWGVYLPTKCFGIYRFKKACERLNEFFKDEKLGINTSYQQETFDENGTCYNVVPKQYSGVPGDKYQNAKTIKRILMLVNKLTVLVGKYHEKNYLHLDIKPTNYLVVEDSNDIIIQFFDLDSLVETDRNGHIKSGESITCSLGYCAPEMRKNNIKQIGPWTDIYSIGVVLLKMICGKTPLESYIDSINSSLNSDISEIFDRLNVLEILDRELPKSRVFIDEKGNFINPSVQKKVRNILEKCLSCFINDRYKTAAELSKELKEAIKLCTTPYIKSNIGSSVGIVGRDDVIKEIEEHFVKGPGTFIISGPGGMGKTCVAHEYWRRNKKDEKNDGKYDIGVYFDYARSDHKESAQSIISKFLQDYYVYNYTYDNEKEIEKKTKDTRDLMNKIDVLILLDNFDMPNDSELRKEYKEFYKEFQKTFPNAAIIITTRTNIKELFNGSLDCNTTQKNLGSLSFDQSFELFKENCGRDVDDQKESYRKLFYFEQGNTKALHILSRLYGKDFHYKKIDDIYQKLTQRISLGGRKVYDENYEEITAEEALCHIYEIAGFQETEKRILAIVYLFRRTKFDQEMIYKIYKDKGETFADEIDKLVIAGWITQSDDLYFLHPLVQFVVEKEIKPNIEQYPELKPYEFYMYFTVDCFSREGELNQSKQLDEGYDELRRKILNSHFEENDRLEKLTIPEDLPLLDSKWAPEDSISPFFEILIEQKKGHIGNDIFVDKNNNYYQSDHNCIFTQNREGGNRLLMMSINNSEIPNDKSITKIASLACYANNNSIVKIPENIKSIGFHSLFSDRDNCDVDFHSFYYYDGIEKDASIKKPIWIFNSLPRVLSLPLTVKSATFMRENVDIVSDFVIDKKRNEIVCNNSFDGSLIEIPDNVQIVDKLMITGKKAYELRLHKNVNWLEIAGRTPGFINQCSKISVDKDNKRYKVIDDCLIRVYKDRDGNLHGGVMYSWGEKAAPSDNWIDCLFSGSQRSINEKTKIIIPPNIKSITEFAFSEVNLEIIEYEGTVNQWNQIEKSPNWFGGFNSKLQKVVCSDGEVEIDKGIKE